MQGNVVWLQSKQKSDESVDASTSQQCVPAKKRKVFDKAELASLDAVFKASNGLPPPSMVVRLADSMDIAKDQVIKKTLTFRFWSFHVVLIVQYPSCPYLMGLFHSMTFK